MGMCLLLGPLRDPALPLIAPCVRLCAALYAFYHLASLCTPPVSCPKNPSSHTPVFLSALDTHISEGKKEDELYSKLDLGIDCDSRVALVQL